jgi:exodeoxyribonuclease VII large subunit
MDQDTGNLPEYSVSELSGAVKRTIEGTFDRVRVRGELGRVVIARSGHMYADLKDERAVIAGVMWKGSTGRLNFKPEEGLEVIAEGRMTTFPGQSKYQIVIESLQPAGAGALMALLEERKRKLQAEGLFDPARKQPIPYLPRTIGVVTSPTGAVIRDILHRLSDRFPRHVLLWPVLVQGQGANDQIAAAIEGFNALPEDGPIPRPDVLIVGRGGGSIEDLWSFNEENVVRAAAASTIPLISAVGHETDTTLIDYSSDRRAPTPTGAAEMAVPVRAELIADVEQSGGRAKRALSRLIETRRTELRAAAAALPKPAAVLGLKRQAFDAIDGRLKPALENQLALKRGALREQAAGLRPVALKRDVVQKRERLDDRGQRLAAAYKRELIQRGKALEGLSARLSALSHEATLKRGFVLVRDEEGRLIREGGALESGAEVELNFADARRQAVIDGAGEAAPKPKAKPAAKPKPKAKPQLKGQGTLF